MLKDRKGRHFLPILGAVANVSKLVDKGFEDIILVGAKIRYLESVCFFEHALQGRVKNEKQIEPVGKLDSEGYPFEGLGPFYLRLTPVMILCGGTGGRDHSRCCT